MRYDLRPMRVADPVVVSLLSSGRYGADAVGEDGIPTEFVLADAERVRDLIGEAVEAGGDPDDALSEALAIVLGTAEVDIRGYGDGGGADGGGKLDGTNGDRLG